MAKKTKKDKEDSKSDILVPELIPESKIRKLTKYPYACPVKLTEEEQDIFITEMEHFITSVEAKRNKYDLLKTWQEYRDAYNGVTEEKDFPWEDCSNLWIHITSMSCDVLRVKAKTQMFVSPVMLLKPLPGQTGKNLYKDIALKEKFLDYKTIEEIEVEQKLDTVIQDGIVLGTGLAKVWYLRKIDYGTTSLDVYEPNRDDIVRFMTKFEDEKGTSEYKEYIDDLVGEGNLDNPAGISVSVWVNGDEITYDNPQVAHVQLEDLYLDPEIADIVNQEKTAEKLKYTWLMIQENCNSDRFDKSIVQYLKALYPEDYWKKEYELIESTKYHNVDKTDRPIKVVATYLRNEKKMVESITFPFMHRQCQYVPYYIKKRSDFFYGEGLAEKLKETNVGLNRVWNQAIDSGTVRNAPMLKAIRNKFDPSGMKYGPTSIAWCETATTDVDVLQFGGVSANEIINLISRMERYAEWLTGITAYMTGRESPLDPNAPMGKAYMLMKESNLRINDFIKSLNNSNKVLYMEIDSLIYQYARGNKLPYTIAKGEEFNQEPISRKVLGIKVRYIPQLSDIVVNKELQKEQDAAFADRLLKDPSFSSNPVAKRIIYETLIRNQGGAWEKSLDKLLPPEQTGISTNPTVENEDIPPVAGVGNVAPEMTNRIPREMIPA